MAHEAALAIVNSVKGQMTGLARASAAALKDERITVFEGLGLGIRTLGFAQQVAALFQSLSREDAQSLLYVLEHASFTLPEEPPHG